MDACVLPCRQSRIVTHWPWPTAASSARRQTVLACVYALAQGLITLLLRMFDHHLHARDAVERVVVEPVSYERLRAERLRMIEPDRVEMLFAAAELELQVLFFQHGLREHIELAAEARCRKALTPDLGFEQLDKLRREAFRIGFAIGLPVRARAGPRSAIRDRRLRRW